MLPPLATAPRDFFVDGRKPAGFVAVARVIVDLKAFALGAFFPPMDAFDKFVGHSLIDGAAGE
jgi:hypothetical protein